MRAPIIATNLILVAVTETLVCHSFILDNIACTIIIISTACVIVCLKLLIVQCEMEQDVTWGITWPATPRGEEAVQQCPGNG